MKRFITGLLLMAFAVPSWAETVMYCSTELATGFIQENGSWRQTRFEGTRHTIKLNDGLTRLDGLSEPGSFNCVVPYGLAKYDAVHCTSEFNDGSSFLLNTKTNRFVYVETSPFGYVGALKESDTDSLSVGTCTKF